MTRDTEPETCGCEHVSHTDKSEWGHFGYRGPARHAMYSVPAGSDEVDFIGAVCDDCSRECWGRK